MSDSGGSIQLGAFSLDSVIGRGGMATVWRATHRSSDTPAAIKILAETGSPEDDVLRFEREVEAVAGLNHPGIVDVFDYGQVSESAAKEARDNQVGSIRAGRPFLAMELADRGSLASADPVTRWPALRSLLLQILDALAFAHAREVVHRDIKPDNVLLFSSQDAQVGPQPKLSDFGIAHALGPEAASQSGLDASDTAGTPQYMPPEQLRARWRDFGPWTDLYALGTMAFEISTGQPPFTGENFMLLAAQHLEEPAPALEPKFPVPDGFEKWLHKLLAKQPTHRFETAADAAAHLEALPRLEAPSPTDETDETDENESSARDPAFGTADTIESPITDTMVLSTDSLPTPEESSSLREESNPPGTNPAVPSTLSDNELPSLDGDIETEQSNARRITTRRTPPAQIVPDDWRRPSVGTNTGLTGIGLGLFGVRTPPMVDRETARDALWQQLRHVQSERSAGLALLQGGSGLGKSRIASETARRARELGCARVLRCSHSSLGGPLSGVGRLLEYLFVTWKLNGPRTLERVRERLGDIYTGTKREDDDRFLDDEAALLVGWMRPTSEQAGRLASRRAGYEAIRRLFKQLTRDRPLIVILDDLQWGSEALGLCEHLVGAGRSERTERASLPVLLVGTVDRDAEPVVGVDDKLDGLRAADTGVTTHDIKRLESSDHRKLVGELLRLAPDLSQRITSRSAGHPLFAIQMVGDLVDRGQLVSSTDGFQMKSGIDESLPESLYAVWHRRLDHILTNTPDRLAVEQAAALGRTVDKAEWRVVCERAGLENPTEAIASLRRRGLVTDDEQYITFAHHSLREAVADEARDARRWRNHHRRCAEILAELYPEGTRGIARRIASHYLSADQPVEALGPLLNAVSEAYEFGDYQLAAELLDRRRDLLELREPSNEVSLHRARGDLWRARVAHRRGERAHAETLVSQVLNKARRHDWSSIVVEAMQLSIDLQLDAGSPDEALQTATELRDNFRDELDPGEEARLWTKLGRIHFERGDLTEARKSLIRGRDIYEQTGASSEVATIDIHLATTHISDHNPDRAEKILEKALPIVRRNGARVAEAQCMNCLGELARHRGNYTEARDYYHQASDLWELSGDRDAAVAQLNEGLTLLDAGEYDEAYETLTETRVMLESHGIRQLLPPVEIGRAAHLIVSGDHSKAAECLQRGIDIAEETRHLSRDFANLVDRVADLCRENENIEWAERLDALASRQRETLERSQT